MEDVERRSHPSLPANYVSFLDLRERWMKNQQQKKQVEEIEQKEVQDNSEELQVDQEQVKPEVESKDDGEDNLLEDRHPDEIPVVQSNPNPNIANRRPSNRKSWHREEGNTRWVPLKEALIQANQASSNEPGPVDIVEQNPLPLNLTDQSKPSLLDIPKVESVAQAPARTRGSDEKLTGQKFNGVRTWKAKVRNQKRNLNEDLLESQLNKGVVGDKVLEEPESLLAVHAHLLKPLPSLQVPGEIEGSGGEDKDRKLNSGKAKKANGRNRKKNQKPNLVESQPNNSVLPPKADARVQLEPKALPPLEANKVVLTVQLQIQSSDEVVTELKLDRMIGRKQNKRFLPKVEDVESVTQPQLKKENLAPKVVEEKESTEQEIGADNNAVGNNGRSETGVVTEFKLDRKMKKKKPFKNNSKRNQKVESVTQPHLEKENPEEEVGADNNAVCDNLRAETESKLAEPKPSCSSGSFVARKQNGRRFERPIMMKKERASGEGSLIWVKKGESSQTGYVAVKNSGNIKV